MPKGAKQLALLYPDNDCGLALPDGDRLEEMQVRLNANTGAWYQNAFFSGRPEANLFARFYNPQVVPQVATPVTPVQIPGGLDQQSGFYNVRLELNEVTCRSRYGGSVELLFNMAEDYQYDIGDPKYVWDLSGLTMRLFLVPVASHFTSPSQASAARVHVEFDYASAVRYARSSLDIAPPAGEDAEIRTALKTAANAIEQASLGSTSVRTNASATVYGFIRRKFAALFPNDNEFVDAIELTDGFIDLHTRTPTRTMVLSTRVNSIDLNTEPGGEEYEVDLWARRGSQSSSVFEELRIGDGETSGWHSIASFPAANCQSYALWRLTVRIKEKDTTLDDDFPSIWEDFWIDCPTLGAEPVGHSETYRKDDLVIEEWGGDPRGYLSLSLRVRIVNR